MAVGQERAYGSRLVSPLFSAGGIDFYALGRLRFPSGEFVDDDGAWIVAVIANEGVRQAEVQHLMERIHNPHLSPDYASGLKFIIVKMGLSEDREKARDWLQCTIHHPGSSAACVYPDRVPAVTSVSYQQPKQCITDDPKEFGGFVLFDDQQYSNSRYNFDHPLSFQQSLVKAANLVLSKNKSEDSALLQIKEAKASRPLTQPSNSCWSCVFPSWEQKGSQQCRETIEDWTPSTQTSFDVGYGRFPLRSFKELSLLFSRDGIDFYGAYPIGKDPPCEGRSCQTSSAVYTVVASIRDENVRRAWAELYLSRFRGPSVLNEDVSHLKYVVVNIEDAGSAGNSKSTERAYKVVGSVSFNEPPSCVPLDQDEKEASQLGDAAVSQFIHHGIWLGSVSCKELTEPFHCTLNETQSVPGPVLTEAVKQMQASNGHENRSVK